MSDIKYIPESKIFMVDGKVIREDELTPNEVKLLKEKAKNATLIIGDNNQTLKNSQVIL